MDQRTEAVQVVYEFDILITDNSEWYFVIALFGAEFVINYGGPELDGYHQWLSEHRDASPLYYGGMLRYSPAFI